MATSTTAKASTHRLDPDIEAGLENLSRLLRQPKNRLINEAVKFYVELKGRKIEHELESTLNELRAHRRKDPNFERSIEAFVEAEAKLSASDPAEGRAEIAGGPVQTEIQRLLCAGLG
jgi:predicted transcriptional regulator